jgi:hypothetical protein
MKTLGVLVALTLALSLASCGASDEAQGGGGASCTPGETRACTCPDGHASTKRCGESGSGFGACDCTADDVVVPSDGAEPDTAGGDDAVIAPDACTPSCGARACGPDGCGGTCGTCGAGTTCSPLGTCDSTACGGASPVLTGTLVTDLGAIDFSGVTATLTHKRDVDTYEDGCLVTIDLDFRRGDGCHFVVSASERVDEQHRLAITQMVLTADSQCPGFPDEREGTYHVQGELLVGDVDPGVAKVPDANAASSCFHSTMLVRLAGVIQHDQTGQTLTLYQTTLSVTADFTSQGSMSAHCPCASSCAGHDCGDDGCGGSCGTCGCGESCEAGSCRFHGCDGLECGDDGCGGSCGTCAEYGANATCTAAGTCTCTKTCTGKQCGPDGCGGACGTCASGKTCNAQGQCVAGTCTPDCGDVFAPLECGDDGCGGSCGTCAAGSTCQSGTCVTGDEPGCVATSAKGCGNCACQSCVCAEDSYCCNTAWDAQCVGLCQQCGSCGGCTPSCTNALGQPMACGDDGCGGSCGTCPATQVCGASGQCGEPASGDWGVTCTTDADCSGGLKCLSFILGLPIGSICTTTCTEGGTECPADFPCMSDPFGTGGPSICYNLGGMPMP